MKPGEPKDQRDSIRPINCLANLEKLVEEWLSRQIIDWANNGDLISTHYHGGHRYFSTQTAKLVIQEKIILNMDSKESSTALVTELSSAFDTLDHNVLLRKLEHHGIRGKELKLIES